MNTILMSREEIIMENLQGHKIPRIDLVLIDGHIWNKSGCVPDCLSGQIEPAIAEFLLIPLHKKGAGALDKSDFNNLELAFMMGDVNRYMYDENILKHVVKTLKEHFVK